jgi:hypothetical protein
MEIVNTEFIWLRIGSSGGLFVNLMNFRFPQEAGLSFLDK